MFSFGFKINRTNGNKRQCRCFQYFEFNKCSSSRSIAGDPGTKKDFIGVEDSVQQPVSVNCLFHADHEIYLICCRSRLRSPGTDVSFKITYTSCHVQLLSYLISKKFVCLQLLQQFLHADVLKISVVHNFICKFISPFCLLLQVKFSELTCYVLKTMCTYLIISHTLYLTREITCSAQNR